MSEKKDQIFLANWGNWPKNLDESAKKHLKQSYFSIYGPYDTFDNIRATLWANRNEKRSVLTGCEWKSIWINAAGGIIPKFYLEKNGVGHAFKIFGWKEIAGESYLIAQLSNGMGVGDKGIFYFPRNVINKELSFGIYTFSDMPTEKAKQMGWSWDIKLKEILKRFLWAIIK